MMKKNLLLLLTAFFIGNACAMEENNNNDYQDGAHAVSIFKQKISGSFQDKTEICNVLQKHFKNSQGNPDTNSVNLITDLFCNTKDISSDKIIEIEKPSIDTIRKHMTNLGNFFRDKNFIFDENFTKFPDDLGSSEILLFRASVEFLKRRQKIEKPLIEAELKAFKNFKERRNAENKSKHEHIKNTFNKSKKWQSGLWYTFVGTSIGSVTSTVCDNSFNSFKTENRTEIVSLIAALSLFGLATHRFLSYKPNKTQYDTAKKDLNENDNAIEKAYTEANTEADINLKSQETFYKLGDDSRKIVSLLKKLEEHLNRTKDTKKR